MVKKYKYKNILSKSIKETKNLKEAHKLTRFYIARNLKTVRGKKYIGKLSKKNMVFEYKNLKNKENERKERQKYEELSDIVRVGKQAVIKGIREGYKDDNEEYNFIAPDNLDIENYMREGVFYEDKDEIYILFSADYNKRVGHRYDIEIELIYNKNSKIFTRVRNSRLNKKDYKGIATAVMRWLN